MTIFEHSESMWFSRGRGEVFEFFSDAHNLQALTPSWLHFRILTPAPIVMQAGALIDYQLRVHGLPIRWRTCIASWEPPFRFVDEQVRGPYRLWVHEHCFEEEQGGTRMQDRVRYAVWGGRLIQRLFVRRDVGRIFAYRRKKLSEQFPVSP